MVNKEFINKNNFDKTRSIIICSVRENSIPYRILKIFQARNDKSGAHFLTNEREKKR